jgi:Family of unknown function (DUF6152)
MNRYRKAALRLASRLRADTATALALTALALSLGNFAQAHHSFAQFGSTTVQITGTVTKFEWTNPHAWIWLEVPDAKGGSVEWALECQSPSGLSRHGWNRKTLQPGDKVTADLHPMRDGSNAGEFVKIVRDDGSVLLPI